MEELANGEFKRVIGEIDEIDAKKVKRVVLCSGKVYYDLLAARREKKITDIAIVRIEQLYPYPEWGLSKTLDAYNRLSEIFWVQEEPQNMGSWHFINRHMNRMLPIGSDFRYVGRPERASPASGSYRICRQEQETLLRAAFD